MVGKNSSMCHSDQFFLAANLKKMLQKVVDSKNEEERMKNFDNIQEIITNVQFAFDEGDSGELLLLKYRQCYLAAVLKTCLFSYLLIFFQSSFS